MNEIIDIYSKIVVATFGFIGPSFTLLISIFIEAIEKARIKNDQQLSTIETLYDDLYNQKEGKDMEKEMKLILKKNSSYKKEIIKESNLLNPKRQIKRVFLPLIVSLFFISLFYLQKTIYCPIKVNSLSKGITLLLSLVSFSYCLFVLWQILNMVIEAKQALIKDKTDTVVKQQNT